MDGSWDLNRLRQLVAENELERGRIEYKRELGNGQKALEAITALVNTFGGAVLVGVDEDQPQGDSRLTGVTAVERDRLVSFCWDQFTPPYSPEIIPVSLGRDDLYVHVVVADPDHARRPVMLNRGNKVLVRLENENRAPDWYRLRDLLNEQRTSIAEMRMPPPDTVATRRPGQMTTADLGLRGRLQLAGPQGGSCSISERVRTSVLDVLNGQAAPVTGAGSSVTELVIQMCGGTIGGGRWVPDGAASMARFSARWGLTGRQGWSLAEAGLGAMLVSGGGRTILRIELDITLTDIRRLELENSADIADRTNIKPPHGDVELDPTVPSAALQSRIGPMVGVGALRGPMLDIIGTLWGLPASRFRLASLASLWVCQRNSTSQSSLSPSQTMFMAKPTPTAEPTNRLW